MMLPKDLFTIYSDSELRRLQGGTKFGKSYFVILLNGNNVVDIYYGKLRNNFQSQRNNSSYPAGYLPFLIDGETRNYDLKTNTFPVLRLVAGKYGLYRTWERHDARIIKSPLPDSELRVLTESLCRTTRRREAVRRAIGTSIERLLIAGDLLQEHVLKTPIAGPPLIADAVARFEFYLYRSSDDVLAELAALLTMESPQAPQQAA